MSRLGPNWAWSHLGRVLNGPSADQFQNWTRSKLGPGPKLGWGQNWAGSKTGSGLNWAWAKFGSWYPRSHSRNKFPLLDD